MWKYAINFVPGLNLFTVEATPCFADVEKVLNTLAIVTALVLNMMFGLAGSVSYDSLIEADTRYYENEHFQYFVDGFRSYDMVGKPPSATFVKYTSISNHLGLFTLFGIVIHYIYFVNGIDQNSDFEKGQMLVWWKHGGGLMIGVFISTLFTSLTYGFYAFGIAGWIKFPDYVAYTEDYDRSPADAFKWKSVLNSSTAMAVYGMTYPFIFSVIISSTIYGLVKTKSKGSTSEISGLKGTRDMGLQLSAVERAAKENGEPL